MAEPITMTIAELTQVLQPPVTVQQLRAMVKAARIQPTGWRPTGKPGHPWPEYDYADIARLHQALLPWLLAGHGTAVSPAIEVT